MRSDTGPFALVPEWVLNLPISDRAVRLYGVLSRFADNETGECWPSRQTLWTRLGCSERSLDAAVKELQAHGAIIKQKRPREDGQAGYQTNAWTVIRTANLAPGGADCAPPPGAENAAKNYSHSELEISPIERDFSDWWAGYPRKVERKQALSAYKARRREGVDHSRLVAARDNYRHAKAGTDPTYIKHGSSFLAKDGPWSEWESGPPEVMPIDVFGPVSDPLEPRLVLPPARVETCPSCESSLLACVCPDRGVPRKANQ